ncbi:MAG TPA: hypothetical protein VFU07_06340 [Candidatus Lumbricidophila sp.]|nr:hypothetical protein [Candidatus Lumbricidophila sp.]
MEGRILLVCTANVCRSVHAAAVIRAVLGRESASHLMRSAQVPGPTEPIEVVSAGTHTQNGWAACAEVVARSGGRTDVVSHASRQLSANDVASATVIFTAEAEHRARAVSLVPDAAARTFTLREAAALGTLVDLRQRTGSLADYAAALDHNRGLTDPILDIADGHGRTTRRHRRALDEIEAAATTVAAGILAWRTPGSDA